ncbi:hypothetical protein EV714DRAFT_254246 [Schizophyllum commune]
MPPKKKAQKIALSDFLADNTLGSWADEVDALPTAPAMRTEEEMRNDRYGGRRDDFLSSRPDRTFGPPREEVPLPDRPPYTAFVGNLAFDLTEQELGDFFQPLKVKEAKVIRDREGKAKGFGYIEFEDVDSLKEALEKSGTSFASRTIRVSVAEPPKERAGFGGGFEDDAKFDNPWRRDKPPPSADRGDSRDRDRDPSQRRFEAASTVSDSVSAWRSAKPRASPGTGDEGPRARRSGFGFGEGGAAGAADAEDSWLRGAKFRPSQPSTPADEHPPSRFGSRRGDMGPPREPLDDGEWRRASRPPRSSTSPTGSTPPTPQLARRKLELLPRTDSTTASPLSSPKLGSAAPAHSRPNPFGAAKPVDVTSREREVEQRVEREREALHSMSRTGSRQGAQRGAWDRSAPTSPKPAAAQAIARTTSSSGSARSPSGSGVTRTTSGAGTTRSPSQANVRPAFSFANAAGGKPKEGEAAKEGEGEGKKEEDKVAEKLGEVTI